MKIQTGDIILLTVRKLDWKIHRYILSLLIRLFTGKYVHTALPFKDVDGVMKIREMEYNGVNRHETLDSYIKKYGKRIHIMRLVETKENIDYINNVCLLLNPKYEYIGLIWQGIKAITGKFWGKKSYMKRTCSEDTARCYNLAWNIFENESSITPMEISKNKNFFILKLYE